MAKAGASGLFRHGMAKWGLFMGLLFSLWFGGWYFFANYADGKLETLTRDFADHGIVVECDQRDIKGFPFRIGVHCDRLSVSSKRDVFRIETGALRTAAQIYEPGKLIVELDGPLKAWPDGKPLTASWSQMRLFADAKLSGGFDVASLNFANIAAQYLNATSEIKSGALHLRPTPVNVGALDIAGNLVELGLNMPTGNAVQPATLSFDVVIANAYKALVLDRRPLEQFLSEGVTSEMRSLVMTTKEGGQLAISGPLEIHRDGTISGEVHVGIAEPKEFGEWAASIDTSLLQPISAIGQAIDTIGSEQQFGSLRLRAIKVTIDHGIARVGFIPLGTIPPLR